MDSSPGPKPEPVPSRPGPANDTPRCLPFTMAHLRDSVFTAGGHCRYRPAWTRRIRRSGRDRPKATVHEQSGAV